MPADFVPRTIDLIRFLPEIILTVMGTLLMVLDAIAGRRREILATELCK